MTVLPTTEQTRTPDAEREILLAVGELADGRTTRARRRLSALWDRSGDDPECIAGHRSAIAHWLADAQTEVEAALTWDERALEEAERLADRRVPFAGTARTVATMLPLLHVEVAQGYRQLDSSCGVLEHLALARDALAALPPDDREAPAREVARLEATLSGLRPKEIAPTWQRRTYADREFWEQEDDPLE